MEIDKNYYYTENCFKIVFSDDAFSVVEAAGKNIYPKILNQHLSLHHRRTLLDMFDGAKIFFLVCY